jgi:hypothetical protein
VEASLSSARSLFWPWPVGLKLCLRSMLSMDQGACEEHQIAQDAGHGAQNRGQGGEATSGGRRVVLGTTPLRQRGGNSP